MTAMKLEDVKISEPKKKSNKIINWIKDLLGMEVMLNTIIRVVDFEYNQEFSKIMTIRNGKDADHLNKMTDSISDYETKLSIEIALSNRDVYIIDEVDDECIGQKKK